MNLAVASLVAVPGVDEAMILQALDHQPAHLLSVITMRREASEPSWMEQVLTVAALGLHASGAVVKRLSLAGTEQVEKAARRLKKAKHVFRLAPQTFLLAMIRVVESIGAPYAV